MGIVVFIFTLIGALVAVLANIFAWTTVIYVFVGIFGLMVIISSIMSFAKGGFLGGILTLIISVGIPCLIAFGLSKLCWDFLGWLAFLCPLSIVIVNVFMRIGN